MAPDSLCGHLRTHLSKQRSSLRQTEGTYPRLWVLVRAGVAFPSLVRFPKDPIWVLQLLTGHLLSPRPLWVLEWNPDATQWYTWVIAPNAFILFPTSIWLLNDYPLKKSLNSGRRNSPIILMMVRLFSIIAEGRDVTSGVSHGFLPVSFKQVHNDYVSWAPKPTAHTASPCAPQPPLPLCAP